MGGGGGGGGGHTGHYGFCHIMRHAVMILFLILYKGQVKSPILHSTRDGSEFLFLKEKSQGGSIPVYYEACLKTQPAHKPLIHHDEKHDFFFHLVNSATMEINYEDMCRLQFGQSQ